MVIILSNKVITCDEKNLKDKEKQDIVIYNGFKNQRQKKGVLKLYDSKTLFGSVFLEVEDLIETPIDYPIELVYYKTNERKDNFTIYGVEIVKNEYKQDTINTERNILNLFTKNENKANHVLEALRKYKVTPTGADDVLYELVKTGSV